MLEPMLELMLEPVSAICGALAGPFIDPSGAYWGLSALGNCLSGAWEGTWGEEGLWAFLGCALVAWGPVGALWAPFGALWGLVWPFGACGGPCGSDSDPPIGAAVTIIPKA